MTSGSSQGLFVIVAVVIFGIFVVISYMLFRDKLQIGLASIFEDSIESTNEYLNPINVSKYLAVSNNTVLSENVIINITDNSAEFITKKSGEYDGVRITGTNLWESSTRYKISMKVKDIDGTLIKFGGHVGYANIEKIIVNGSEFNSTDWSSAPILFNKKAGEEKEITVIFKTESDLETKDYLGFYMQPNRGVKNTAYHINIYDIELTKL